MMHEHGKSDRPIVPEKPANEEPGAPSSAEGVEERGLAEGNSGEQNRDRARDRAALQSALTRIRQAAEKDKELRFTTLWHHVYDIRRLREAFLSMKKKAAAGADGVTWQQYNERREENLRDLSERLKNGAYRAKPVRRKFIPKADGRMRPLGIPTIWSISSASNTREKSPSWSRAKNSPPRSVRTASGFPCRAMAHSYYSHSYYSHSYYSHSYYSHSYYSQPYSSISVISARRPSGFVSVRF